MTDAPAKSNNAEIARLQQERENADGLAKSHEQEIEHLQSSIQSLRTEYKLCRERLMVLADAAVEHAATREAEALREEIAEIDRRYPEMRRHLLTLRRQEATALPSADDTKDHQEDQTSHLTWNLGGFMPQQPEEK